MKLSAILVSLALAQVGYTHGATLPIIPRSADGGACTSTQQRVNWEALSSADKQGYISAIKCMQTKPKKTTLKESRNLFDDFVNVHIHNNAVVHFNAFFLPWHRLFVLAREQALRECGYTGPTPYWDWTKSADANDVANDPIFSPTDGFGGNGDPNNGNVVKDGPFANFTVDLSIVGVGANLNKTMYNPHNLTRSFEPANTRAFTTAIVNEVQAIPGYADYRYNIESAPHGVVHAYVSGDMTPPHSPNDPLFFLHHAAIDRLWTLWQEQDKSKRVKDYSGPLPFQYPAMNAKITDQMPSFFGLIDDSTVEEVMDTTAGRLCYRYV
ncbi:putative protein kinase [Pseudozyma hubeiensis]|nr:putative protein kinase [Pseudozyma hubeiensis]